MNLSNTQLSTSIFKYSSKLNSLSQLANMTYIFLNQVKKLGSFHISNHIKGVDAQFWIIPYNCVLNLHCAPCATGPRSTVPLNSHSVTHCVIE